ncbi:IclR family transcriptional regulator [Corynebacterium guangdongense]|uniref:DNA-binding IclR family transcriptional regulator n=1 Tax=Corynebacterium guangdongense TaxID=1783348 RepID=A0ABU2A124_9CORY|nr:IclR family transcriptional regulator C-terminal domain-containing protein [Corynebacterium guangdongense]MDR7330884.1 DNA-binding IclR family transcriptional regulator [Corynebacterium guangdongense]WJZ16899.1 Pectin degradation repressor protein KdgR [Corynebacterium guangdongense]
MVRKNSGTIASVDRALIILRRVIEDGSITVTAAADLLEVNPSTASRLLATLQANGFVTQGPKRDFTVGPVLSREDHKAEEVRITLRPFLERLLDLSGETVHLATLIGTEVYHLDGIEAHGHTIVHAYMPGWVFPAHHSSQGRAMLAELTLTELHARYAAVEPGEANALTPAEVAELHKDLQAVRDQGYATNFERSEKGVAALSVSLGIRDGAHLALSAALPIIRYTPELGEKLRDALLTVRRDINNTLNS